MKLTYESYTIQYLQGIEAQDLIGRRYIHTHPLASTTPTYANNIPMYIKDLTPL